MIEAQYSVSASYQPWFLICLQFLPEISQFADYEPFKHIRFYFQEFLANVYNDQFLSWHYSNPEIIACLHNVPEN